MIIIIANDYDGTPISAVMAENEKLAMAYWHGRDIIPHTTRVLSENELSNHPTGVIPIFNTKEERVGRDTIRVIDKQ